ncbi:MULTISPECIES: NIPSNAP family protein [unclassified Aureimonas]|uniref:NIPSNAP family protein n=1 Tax=unclassified Aureimonas TaxID=2615206 RepID=UPI0007000E7F|nr:MULTISPECIES: NIPSNAP family protein [unclassified Aureimonas]KQT62931.1 NIPSNAP family containing protein [Aureimonas sp. Leaf427]KQT74832.1 NIPSNAP family containing protein [Aureimonas sp. Leaf460]
MIHERRVYHAAPKKVGLVVKRFKEHNTRIYERLGIKTIGAWTVIVGEANDQFIYLLEWESLAEREQKWGAFLQDEEWQRVWAETDKDGALVRYASNELLQPVAL